jgi:hypothetical protein
LWKLDGRSFVEFWNLVFAAAPGADRRGRSCSDPATAGIGHRPGRYQLGVNEDLRDEDAGEQAVPGDLLLAREQRRSYNEYPFGIFVLPNGLNRARAIVGGIGLGSDIDWAV